MIRYYSYYLTITKSNTAANHEVAASPTKENEFTNMVLSWWALSQSHITTITSSIVG
jgi:hypothetical protein